MGLLLELGGSSTDAVTIEGLTVSGSGTHLGAVAQGGLIEDGWDSVVERDAATSSNDASFDEALETVSTIPSDSHLPNAAVIEEQGVAGIIGDCS